MDHEAEAEIVNIQSWLNLSNGFASAGLDLLSNQSMGVTLPVGVPDVRQYLEQTKTKK